MSLGYVRLGAIKYNTYPTSLFQQYFCQQNCLVKNSTTF